MQISYAAGQFIAESTFREKDIPKGTGFRWDRSRKVWWTDDWRKAQALAEYCDDAARDAIERARQREAEAV